ncbi:TolB-like 6-bladed beta-propeller domain-containing protein [Halosquirtibacter laminarini]|uniref:TolB-like 6-bladed beta-propeller domain-containing protein n=1 Tax=Halosquirtibacter laminarini TaxID=3374600 RepID=A0AC61NHG1_9BACT|nr:TolB-like 6-bladed beta-propeller domain-containing protein [Prolixibacteraceae bacterium]
MNLKLYLVIVLLLGMSCTNKVKENNIQTVDQSKIETIDIKLEKHSVEGKLLNPTKIGISENKLIFLNNVDGTFLSIYENEKQDYKFCGNQLHKGKGKGEIAREIDNHTFRVKGNKVEFCDLLNIYEYNIEGTPNKKLTSLFEFDRSYFPVNCGFRLYNNYYFKNTTPRGPKIERLFQCTDGKSTKEVYPFPTDLLSKSDANKGRGNLWQIFAGSYAIDPQDKKMFISYQNFPQIDIIDTQEMKKMGTIRYAEQRKTTFFDGNQYAPSSKNYIYGNEIYTTKNRVYALILEQSKETLSTIDFENPSVLPYILVIDMDGKPQYRLNLDHLILSFAVSEDDTMLYGASPFESNTIFSYNLKN